MLNGVTSAQWCSVSGMAKSRSRKLSGAGWRGRLRKSVIVRRVACLLRRPFSAAAPVLLAGRVSVGIAPSPLVGPGAPM
jgi:hypothetical protein